MSTLKSQLEARLKAIERGESFTISIDGVTRDLRTMLKLIEALEKITRRKCVWPTQDTLNVQTIAEEALADAEKEGGEK